MPNSVACIHVRLRMRITTRVSRTSMRNARSAIVRQSFANPSCSRASDDKRNNGEQRQGCEGWLRPLAITNLARGEGPFDKGAVPTIVRRPLGLTMKHTESEWTRCRHYATVSQFYCIANRATTSAELRGVGKHRGRFVTADHYQRANDVPLCGCGKGIFSSIEWLPRRIPRRTEGTNEGDSWHREFRKRRAVDRFYHFLPAISTANPANTT